MSIISILGCGKVEFMQKRYGSDTKFILEGDKSIEAVRNWTNKLFQQKRTEVFKWFVEVVFRAYEKAESDLVKRMILVKIIHTREVVRAGFDIAFAEKKYAWNEYQVETVCLLHDVARFDQALLGSFWDYKTGFDHAQIGAEMIKSHSFADFDLFGVDKKSVIEAVKYHSGYQYTGSDVYAKLTRDADKLALMRAMPEILATNIGEFTENGVSDEALRSFKGGEMVHHRDMNTKADFVLGWLAWENDLNFSTTKKCFVDEGIKEWMLGELALLKVQV